MHIRSIVCCSVLQCVAVCCSVLQCVAVCCSVAVCCNVLGAQCIFALYACSMHVFALCAFWHKCCGQRHDHVTQIYVKRDLYMSKETYKKRRVYMPHSHYMHIMRIICHKCCGQYTIMSHTWLNIYDYVCHPILWVQSWWPYIRNTLWHPTCSIDDYYAILYSEHSNHVTDALLCVCTCFQKQTHISDTCRWTHSSHTRAYVFARARMHVLAHSQSRACTYVGTYVRKHTRTYAPTCTLTHPCAQTHACTHAQTRTHTPYLHFHRQTRTQMHTHARVHNIHVHKHARTHTHIHTLTHADGR